MSYLSCPSCGLTMFDRNPLTSPRHCPRCARRNGASIELERVSKLTGGAAASLLEVVRGMYERRERGNMDVEEFVHPEIVFVRIGSDLPDVAGEWHGVDGMRKATVEYLNVWEDYRFEVERMIDLGDGVLVLEKQTARGKRSGAIISKDVGTLLTLRDGKIVRWEYYWERAEALEAAGIKE
jgi:ketosteroid isomerase-like protein